MVENVREAGEGVATEARGAERYRGLAQERAAEIRAAIEADEQRERAAERGATVVTLPLGYGLALVGAILGAVGGAAVAFGLRLVGVRDVR